MAEILPSPNLTREKYRKMMKDTLRRCIFVQGGGLLTSTGVVLVVLVLVFVVRGVAVVIIDVVASHYGYED